MIYKKINSNFPFIYSKWENYFSIFIVVPLKIFLKTYYRNFLSKDDVLNSFIDTILHDYVNATQQQQKKYSLVKTFDIIFDFCERNKEILLILHNNRLLYLLLEKLNLLILNEHMIYNSEVPENRLESQLLTEYIIYFNIGGIWNLIVRWIENNMCDSVVDIKESVVFYLSNIGKIDIRDI